MAYFTDKKCKQCKNIFTITNPSGYAFKLKTKDSANKKYFCSWTCLLKYKKAHNLMPKLKFTKEDKWGNIK